MKTLHFPPVQASLGAAQAEYRGLQLVLVNSRHQRVQRAEISGLQFQPVHRGLLNGRNADPYWRDSRELVDAAASGAEVSLPGFGKFKVKATDMSSSRYWSLNADVPRHHGSATSRWPVAAPCNERRLS
jgi:hypothetical protein